MSRRSRIDGDPIVLRVAEVMGIRQRFDLSNEICLRAADRVGEWLGNCGIEPRALDEVHALVLNQTGLSIRRVTTDEELQSALDELRRHHPAVPVQLEFEFRAQTEAVVVRLKGGDRRSASRYLAIVDARGERRSRAWFGERHEPSHVIIPDPDAQAIFRRTRVMRPEPIEQVVDAVASAIGFWRPIVKPAFDGVLRCHTNLLDALEEARALIAPEASKDASYWAFIELIDRPVLVLWANHQSRRADAREGGDPMASLALRAARITENAAARKIGMTVWPNYRIPPDSVIALAHDRPYAGILTADDNLGRWPTKTGRPLKDFPVRITARGPWAVIELNG